MEAIYGIYGKQNDLEQYCSIWLATIDSNSRLILQVLGLGSPLSDTQTREIQTFRDGFAAALWFPAGTCSPPRIAFTDNRICTKSASGIWISATTTTGRPRSRISSNGRRYIPSTIPRATQMTWRFWKRARKCPSRVSFFTPFYNILFSLLYNCPLMKSRSKVVALLFKMRVICNYT